MAKSPVHWYEGMFLKPQHFQTADRYDHERIRESEDWLHPYNYGFRHLDIDEAAVGNNRLVLRECQARFKDGTMLTVRPDDGDPKVASEKGDTKFSPKVDSIDFSAALEGVSEVIVYLAVPHAKSVARRYAVETIPVADENHPYEREDIEVRRIQARLLVSGEDTKDFTVLPLAKIVRTGQIGSPPQIDPSYVPPILAFRVSSPLAKSVDELFETIKGCVTEDADLMVGRKVTFESRVLGDADRVLRLATLNAAQTTFQSVIKTRGLHPFIMYTELCRLLGQVSIFGETRRPIEVSGYDHDNIKPIYAKVIGEINRILGVKVKAPYVRRPFRFVSETRRYCVALEPEWLREPYKLYLGVETGELNDDECDDLLKETDKAFGSCEEIEEIFQRGDSGLRIWPLKRPSQELPTGVVYFELDRNPVYWDAIVRKPSLGLRFPGERCKFINQELVELNHKQTRRAVKVGFAAYAFKPTP